MSKSYDVFQPESLRERVHIIGCGSVGSTLAEILSRYGVTKISLYDMDIVKPHNLANQMFFQSQVAQLKTEATAQILRAINPEIDSGLKLFSEGYQDQPLAGYVFLCLDNIDLRREIATKCKGNPNIKAMFDIRTGLFEAQHFAAEWQNATSVKQFLNTMNFTSEEAKAETPVSACNIEMSVVQTIRVIVAYAVSNFFNYIAGKKLVNFLTIDTQNMKMEAYY